MYELEESFAFCFIPKEKREYFLNVKKEVNSPILNELHFMLRYNTILKECTLPTYLPFPNTQHVHQKNYVAYTHTMDFPN